MLYIKLFHGRKSPYEDMDDWGYDGPFLGPFTDILVTYENIRLFTDYFEDVWLHFCEGCAFYDGHYYGDFFITHTTDGRGDPQIPLALEFDPKNYAPPRRLAKALATSSPLPTAN